MAPSLGTLTLLWWLLPAHMTATTFLLFALIGLVQDKLFAVNQQPQWDVHAHRQLAQNSAVALISAGLTIIRALAGAAITLIGWRMAFVALATGGSTLAQVDNMISWRTPPLRGHTALWLVFFLSLPAQFSSPVLQGAINWIPATQYKTAGVRDITTAGRGVWWEWHNMYTRNRYSEVLRAAGIAALASPENFQRIIDPAHIPSIPSRRVVPSLSGEVLGTQLSNISLPFFQAHSLQWAQSLDDLRDDMKLLNNTIWNGTSPSLSYGDRTSQRTNLFGYSIGTERARLVLVNEKEWTPQSLDENNVFTWPTPTISRQSKWVIVALWYIETCDQQSTNLGPITNAYLYSPGKGCYAFAKLNYTAGVIECDDCDIVADKVVEASANTSRKVIPDPFVETAIAMIPDVLYYMVAANATLAPTWNNLNGYTVGMVATAYQAGWNSLINRLAQEAMWPLDQASIRIPVSVLQARITKWRVWVWFALNACLAVSGFVLVLYQRRMKTIVVGNPALAAFLVNPQSVFDRHPTAFHNTNNMTRPELSVHVRLDQNCRPPRLIDDSASAQSSVRRRVKSPRAEQSYDDAPLLSLEPLTDVHNYRGKPSGRTVHGDQYVDDAKSSTHSTLTSSSEIRRGGA